jgi:hypothetical protein
MIFARANFVNVLRAGHRAAASGWLQRLVRPQLDAVRHVCGLKVFIDTPKPKLLVLLGHTNEV